MTTELTTIIDYDLQITTNSKKKNLVRPDIPFLRD